MPKGKALHIIIERINCNKFVVEEQIFDYLELVTWFKEIITE